MLVPLNVGPGTGYSVQPSGQCCPVAVGPLSTLHLLRSKLARCELPPSDTQAIPLLSISTLCVRKPSTPGAFGLLNGGSYTSVRHVDGGLAPTTILMIFPGTAAFMPPLTPPTIQTLPSIGLKPTP